MAILLEFRLRQEIGFAQHFRATTSAVSMKSEVNDLPKPYREEAERVYSDFFRKAVDSQIVRYPGTGLVRTQGQNGTDPKLQPTQANGQRRSDGS